MNKKDERLFEIIFEADELNYKDVRKLFELYTFYRDKYLELTNQKGGE